MMKSSIGRLRAYTNVGTMLTRKRKSRAIMERSLSTQSNEPAQPARNVWFWRYFPTFWTVLFVIGLALDTLGVYALHPDRLDGWRVVGLGVLLIGVVGGYQWFTWRHLYR